MSVRNSESVFPSAALIISLTRCYSVFNRKGFGYIHCICDPDFPSSQYHRQSETEPYGPRFNFEDASNHILFDPPGRTITTEKGFRMARANIGAREGRWYWECKILSGVKHPDSVSPARPGGGHVRIGWARREASLDTPVGFDAYSYGLRDVDGQKVHMSRPKDFLSPKSDFCEGDVIGMEITLPSLSFHRKVVESSYNKAVDVSDDVDPPHPAEAPNIIRDRVPIRYKNQIYFEHFEYHPTKELEDLMNPIPTVIPTSTGAAGNANASAPPSPNHPVPALRTLPFSSIKVYRNGQYVGEPFSELLSFLPPASKPLAQVGARDGLDDGMLGYFPAVSVFRGGAAEVNFGPDFWFPPPDLDIKAREDAQGDIDMIGGDHPAEPVSPASGLKAPLRPLSDRFEEQIAEETIYDIVDEVDFWSQDTSFGEKEGPEAAQNASLSEKVPAALMGHVDPEAADVRAVVNSSGMVGTGGEGVIKEVVQEDE